VKSGFRWIILFTFNDKNMAIPKFNETMLPILKLI